MLEYIDYIQRPNGNQSEFLLLSVVRIDDLSRFGMEMVYHEHGWLS